MKVAKPAASSTVQKRKRMGPCALGNKPTTTHQQLVDVQCPSFRSAISNGERKEGRTSQRRAGRIEQTVKKCFTKSINCRYWMGMGDRFMRWFGRSGRLYSPSCLLPWLSGQLTMVITHKSPANNRVRAMNHLELSVRGGVYCAEYSPITDVYLLGS